jgi:nucleotide-binding universal stress UspA family protein
MRVVLAHLNADDGDPLVLDMARVLARPQASHIRALYVHEDPRLLATLASPEAASVVGSVIRAAEQDRDDSLARTGAGWRAWCERHNIALDGTTVPGAPERLTSEFVDCVADPLEEVGCAGRFADVTVLARAANGRATVACEAALFASGRPVLIVPRSTATADPLDTIVIAWDERAEASRAVAAALPLLRRARQIHVVHCTESSDAAVTPEPVVAFLRWHGLATAGMVIAPAEAGVAATLTDAAMARGAGMIVMGAYGHGRLRELVFGGVTRDMLAAAPLPLLMMH